MAATAEWLVPAGAGAVRVRCHDPGPAGRKPALVYLHGGGWTLFSLDTHDRLMRELAARAGVAVVGVDYALSPEAKYPTALEQVVAVARFLSERGGELGVEEARVALGGDSAGANLALATSLRLRDEGEGGRVRALLLAYGVYQRWSSPRARERFGGDGYMLGSDEMDRFWRNYLRSDHDLLDPLVCPINAELGGLPPALLVVPECDLLTEQSLAMAERLLAAGVPTTLERYPGATHSFLEAVSIAPLADRALADAAAWLRRELFETS
jgi:acetyl esterase